MNTEENAVPNEEADSSTTEVGGGKRKVLSQVIPTARLTLPKQVDIIRAYGAAYDVSKAPVGIEEVTKLVGMAAATVSQANAFLTDTGLVRKEGRRFVPASELLAMNRLYEVNRDRALGKLAPLLEKSWFGQIVMPKVRFRPVAEEEVVHDLFEAATAEPPHLPQVRMLIDYLVLVGLVERDGLLLKGKSGGAEDVQATTAATLASTGPGAAPVPVLDDEPPAAVLLLTPDGSRRVTVKAPPTITTAELARIRSWLEFQLIVKDEAPAKEGGET